MKIYRKEEFGTICKDYYMSKHVESFKFHDQIKKCLTCKMMDIRGCNIRFIYNSLEGLLKLGLIKMERPLYPLFLFKVFKSWSMYHTKEIKACIREVQKFYPSFTVDLIKRWGQIFLILVEFIKLITLPPTPPLVS
jgi:hypothetical protein